MLTTLRRFAGPIAVLLLLPLTAAAFEGRVTLAMRSGQGAEQVIAYAFKDGLVRLDPQMAGAVGSALIINPRKREMILLMPEPALYLVMTLKDRPAAGEAATDRPAKFEQTGETDLILGHVCTLHLMTDADGVTEMWITEDLGPFAGFGGGLMGGVKGAGRGGSQAGAGPAWEQALQERPAAFPLRIVTRDRRGAEVFRLEAREVQPGPLPDALFAPPSHYRKFSLPAGDGVG